MNERRKHCRVSGAMVSDTIVRVRPGHEAALINLCTLGALIELRRPIAPGLRVDVQLTQNTARLIVRALVLRCSVRAIAALEGVTYEAALLFDETCDFGRAATARDGYRIPDEVDGGALNHVSHLPERNDVLEAVVDGSAK